MSHSRAHTHGPSVSAGITIRYSSGEYILDRGNNSQERQCNRGYSYNRLSADRCIKQKTLDMSHSGRDDKIYCDKCTKCESNKHASWLFSYLQKVLDDLDTTQVSDGSLLDTFCDVVVSSTSVCSNKYTARVMRATVRLTMYHTALFRRRVTMFAPVYAYRVITDNIVGTLNLLSRTAKHAPGDGLLAAARCSEAFLQIVFGSLNRIITNNLMADMKLFSTSTNRTMAEFGKELESVASTVTTHMDLPSVCIYRDTDSVEFGYDENDKLRGEVVHANFNPNNYKCTLRHLAVDGLRCNVTVMDKC